MYKVVFLVLFLLALSATESNAQYEFVDSSLGGDGGIRTDVTNFTDFPLALAYRSNDRILVLSKPIGQSIPTKPNHYSLIQYYSNDGRLDRSFGNQGIATVPIKMASLCFVSSMHLAEDGTVLLVGADSARGKLFLTRYTSRGVPDSSFGINGVAFSEDNWMPSDFVVLPNRKIVVIGWGKKPGFVDGPFMIRFNENGSRDFSFGSNGVTDFRDYPISKIVPKGIAVQKNGNFIIAARLSRPNSHTTYQALLRCLPNGTVDTSFGVRGESAVGATTEDIEVSNVIAIPDSQSILCTSVQQWYILRFTADGIFDSTLGNKGRLSLDSGKSRIAFLTIQSDGSILASGFQENDGRRAISLGRYHSDGSVDKAFGNDGTILSSKNVYDGGAWRHLVQPNGRILVAADLMGTDMTIARFKAQKYTGGIENNTSFPILEFQATIQDSEIALNFEMDHPGSVIPVLSDILGRQIILGNSEFKKAGASSMKMRVPPDLPAGLYIVSLRVNGTVSKGTVVEILR